MVVERTNDPAELIERYESVGHSFRLEVGAHACAYFEDECTIRTGVHGGRLWELTQTEADAVAELYGAVGVAAAQFVLGARYRALPQVDPLLPGATFPLVQAGVNAVPMYKWQGSYRDPTQTSRTTYGPGFATRQYASRHLETVRARSATERREVGRPEYDRWRLLLFVPQTRVELVEER